MHEVFARCVVVGTAQFVEVIQRLEEEESPGVSQILGEGREYRAAMRGLFAELRVRWAIRRGLIRDSCSTRPGCA